MLQLRIAITALLSIGVLIAVPARAAAGVDLCNDVLQQDVFNRTSGASQASESEQQAYLDAFFETDDTTAYNEYKKARSEQHNAATSVHAEGHYGIIGGEFDLSTEHGAAMSFSDFSSQFKALKKSRQKQSSGSSSRASSLISSYQSTIRDSSTMEAWRQCMLSRTSEPSVVAYGYRDAGGNPYLTVMWLPGRALAAIAPQVDVGFVSTDADIVVEGAAQPVTLAAGSGKAFVLRYKTPEARARYQGFAILVNATARDGTRHLMDFQEQATVPGVVGEVPCDLLIQPGREYGFLVYMPTITGAEDIAAGANAMILQVNDLIPSNSAARQEYNARVSFSQETSKKLIAQSNNNPKMILRAMHVSKAWIATQGSTLTLRLEKNMSQPGVLGDPAVGRCTLKAAEGSVPGDTIAMKFRITGRN